MGNLRTFVRPSRCLMVAAGLLPMVAALGESAITTISTTTTVVAAPQTRNGIPGQANAGTGSPYNVTYDGISRRIDSLVAGGNTYLPDAGNIGVAYVRRNTATPSPDTFLNQNQTTAWNQLLSGNPNTTAHTVAGQYINTMDALFTSRNTRTGTENLFINQGDPNNTSSNVERVDYVFGSSFLADPLLGFSVLERGRGPGTTGNGANGGFKIAAILSVDGSGVPTAFGSTVLHVLDDSYNNGGAGVGVTSFRYDVFSGNPDLDVMTNVDKDPQGIAGALIYSTDLVPAGTPIIGYAVFGEDVTGTGAQLVDWNNSAFYPQDSGLANDMDMVASGAVKYTTTEVPEASTTAAMLAVGAMAGGAFLRRRFGRK